MKGFKVCALLMIPFVLQLRKTESSQEKDVCLYTKSQIEPFDGLYLYPTSEQVSGPKLLEMKEKSRVCLPNPCEHLNAYSGLIPVDDESDSCYLFFLLIESESDSSKKPLLLWLQGGPGKSSLFGQFLENGPPGIDASRKLYYRNHTIINYMNVIYLDQPAGSGYSFDDHKKYTGTLQEASLHIARFLNRFLRIFPEYKRRPLYIAGESYGARSAVGAAHQILSKPPKNFSFRFKGVMLGVGFLFPLLDIIDSTKYLSDSGLLGDHGRQAFMERFQLIRSFVEEAEYSLAAKWLTRTVLNAAPSGENTLFRTLTGFEHQGSIVKQQQPKEVSAYFQYANSSLFKRIVHVDSSRVLDGTSRYVLLKFGAQDFFVNIKTKLEHVLDNTNVFFYTAQLDAVFPAAHLEQSLKDVTWRCSDSFKKAHRQFWYRSGNPSNELLGYIQTAGSLMYATVLSGGHDISLEQSAAISDLYQRFLKLTKPTTLRPCKE